MKRRLTDQQQRRISSAKKEKVIENLSELGEGQLGLVVSHFGNTLEVENPLSLESFRCHARQNLGPIVVGDQVVFYPEVEGNAELGLVTARKDRISLLTRPDVYKQQKEIAANIDQMFITMAAEPEVVPYFIDKYLVAAELQKITPVLIFNKADLFTPEAYSQAVILLERYRKLGYRALFCSIYQDLNELKNLLQGKTSIFAGPSGVGKSALINALLGENQAVVGEISAQNQKGCHTTTRSSLYHLPNSMGNIIDSPGIREFGLWNISPEQAALGFIEFQEFLGRCKFRDCQHGETPGCALAVGIREKKISPERLLSFRRLLSELQKFQR
jgi:ribosome biogenesis GTPase / thiamine phosphate phosphatase